MMCLDNGLLQSEIKKKQVVTGPMLKQKAKDFAKQLELENADFVAKALCQPCCSCMADPVLWRQNLWDKRPP